MTWKHVKKQTQYYLQYFPLTLNGVICIIIAFIAYQLLYTTPTKEEETTSAFLPFIYLMGKMVFWFAVCLLTIAILSTVVAWLHYLYLRSKHKTNLQLSFSHTAKGHKKNYYLHATLPGVRRPILGFVKARLFYDDKLLTDKFTLLSNKYNAGNYLREAIAAKSQLELPDIKEYTLKGGFVFFEDLLHIFSIAVPQDIIGHFHQPPTLQAITEDDIAPKKTETLDVRIEQMRRVEGDPLSYKDFEAGDDVRRIVWKVYAKNKDLVVRVPEMFEPYASHLYCYASFYANIKTNWWSENYQRELLNYYKNAVWTVFDTLSKKEWEVRFIPDQDFKLPEHLSLAERVERIISNSAWQNDKNLNDYFNAKQGAVLCISSFTDTNELAQTLALCDNATVIYFAKCSKTFGHFIGWSWLKRLLFLPPKDRLSRLRSTWLFSPFRLYVLRREKKIEDMLQQSGVKYGIF